MADLSVTAANVAMTSNTVYDLVQVGESVTQGQPGYRSSSDGKFYRGDADAAATAVCTGVFMTPASTSGYAVFATDGLINLGATLTVGMVYVVSTTAGGIAPYADLGSGDYVNYLGIATTAALLDLQPHGPAIAKP